MGRVPQNIYKRNSPQEIEVRIHSKFMPSGRRNVIAHILHETLNKNLNYNVNSFDVILELRQRKNSVGIIAVNFNQYETYVDIWAPECHFTRASLKKIFGYLFKSSNHVTAIVSSDNKKCLSFMSRLGFIIEGRKRHTYDGVADEIIYGMLRQECKWIAPDKI